MASPQMIHEILPVGLLKCNCMILGDPLTREAVVLDPGEEVDRILAVLARHSLTVRAIVSTHAHIDHVGGLHKLQQVTGAPVLMHGDDLDLYRHIDVQAAFIGLPNPVQARIDQVMREGDTVRWGAYSASVLHTPGHTPGSVSLYLPERSGSKQAGPGAAGKAARVESSAPILFAGDTLFAGSVGRTDLWGGSPERMMESLRNKLMVLPDETVVYPGHGIATTIGAERADNPYLNARNALR